MVYSYTCIFRCILICVCVLELIPSLYKMDYENTGLFILLGFFLQIILDYFSHGIEHGHVHVKKNHSVWFPLTTNEWFMCSCIFRRNAIGI